MARLYDAEQRLSARTGIIDRVEMLEDRLVQAETTALTKVKEKHNVDILLPTNSSEEKRE